MTIATLEPTIVLVGFESVGKSALFRHLTGQASGDEANFRGSTVQVRSSALADGTGRLIDTPGIRSQDDTLTTRLALAQTGVADTLVLVVRGTHAGQEIGTLLQALGSELVGRNAALVLTFGDRAAPALEPLRGRVAEQLGIPVVTVNARSMDDVQRNQVLSAIQQARPLSQPPLPPAVRTQPIELLLPAIPVVQPEKTWFEHRQVGPWLALLLIALLFVLPVYLAYRFADWAQPLVDGALITPLVERLSPLAVRAPLLFALLAGDYGWLTLGWYSLLWAFPVVLLLGVSVALSEESGLKDRITAALDPWLRQIGLNGRDLVPVLSGFGCNVVAVFQSRSCSRCTRQACVSLIAFGSACSYQIGASLSLFNSAGKPWLFAPYLTVLFLAGALHTRLWQRSLPATAALPLAERAFLQRPTLRGVWWRVKTVLRQFLREALPIFLIICAVGAVLEYLGVIDWLSAAVAPLLRWFGLPAAVAPALIFSVIRKDGLLVLNQDHGRLLQAMHGGQLFVVVYLASTLTACLVTLWTIGRELGWQQAGLLAGRQLITALASTALLAALLAWLGW